VSAGLRSKRLLKLLIIMSKFTQYNE
jgi:hypothetical protein